MPVVCKSLALEAAGQEQGSAGLVLLSLGVAGAGFGTLAIYWRRIVAGLGNAGLATIASIAGLQFLVAYASRVIGSVAGAILGPMYVFIDGIGSKGLSCLFLGVLVALLPQPGALSLRATDALRAQRAGQRPDRPRRLCLLGGDHCVARRACRRTRADNRPQNAT